MYGQMDGWMEGWREGGKMGRYMDGSLLPTSELEDN